MNGEIQSIHVMLIPEVMPGNSGLRKQCYPPSAAQSYIDFYRENLKYCHMVFSVNHIDQQKTGASHHDIVIALQPENREMSFQLQF